MFVRMMPLILLMVSHEATLLADDPPSLQQQLAKEPIADLVKAARLRGDAGRGAILFFQPFLTCSKCHDGEAGTQLGPDIAKTDKKVVLWVYAFI